jgi:hypothetical protein
VLILKFETIIKIHYALEPEEIEQLNILSPFLKNQFIHMARQKIVDLIQENVESDKVEVSITVYE